jgi:hypothetical protein
MSTERPRLLIDRWLGPNARLLERHELSVAASIERAYAAVRQVRLGDMPLVRALFRIRGIPHSKEITLRQFFSTPPFLILEEDPPHEFVIGVAGRLSRQAAVSSPEEFRCYTSKGAIKAIANFRVESMGGDALLSTQTWIETYGPRARWLFRAYWLVVGPFSAFTRRAFLRAARTRAQA